MSQVEPLDDPPLGAQATRRACLRFESDIKSVGQLCYLVAAFSGLGTVEFMLVALGVIPYPPTFGSIGGPELIRAAFWLLTAFMTLNTAGQAALGYGLTHLQSWARWTVVVLTAMSLASTLGLALIFCVIRPALGLPGLGIGLILHGLILQPLLTPRSAEVFSEGYREVIRATPQIRARMHWLLRLTIGAILASVLAFAGFLAAIYFRWIDW